MKDVDVIIDATDNFKSRSLINKISLLLKKTLGYGCRYKDAGASCSFSK